MKSPVTSASPLLFLAIAACGGGTTGEGTTTTAAAGSEPAAAECGRDCLTDITKVYLAALVARNTSAAPLATDSAFVENV